MDYQGNENPNSQDATIDWSFGQDAYHEPDRIQPNAYAKGVNIKCDRGIVSPRYGNQKVKLTFDDDTLSRITGLQVSVENVFLSGKFQSWIPYTVFPEHYFIVVVNGFVYRLNTRTKHVTLLSKTQTVNAFSSRINWSFAGDYIVLFDYPNFPLIIQDELVFRADPNNIIFGIVEPQIPLAATVGTYNQNRLAVANNGNEWTAGDPTGNLATPQAPITFTEIQPGQAYPGQVFQLGTSITGEPITAMGFLQSVDQNTQVGPLFVATENSVYYYRTDLPRVNWADPNGTLQFGSLLLFNAGIVGPRAQVNVNSDLMFESAEGKIHAVSTARNDAKTWGNVPISREVENWLTFSDDSLKQYSFLQYLDNRVFISANPFRVNATTLEGDPIFDYAFGGTVVLNLNSMATLHEEKTPSWDGLWTAPYYPMDMGISNKKAYVIGKDEQGFNSVWLMEPQLTYDLIDGNEVYIDSIVETREYYSESRFLDKVLQAATLALTDVQGKFSLSIERRPSQVNNFYPWTDWQYDAPVASKYSSDYKKGLVGHNFKNLIFGAPEEECEDNQFLNTFRKLQIRLRLSGKNWNLTDFKLDAISKPQDARNNACTQEETVTIPFRCNNYWKIKGVDLCKCL